MGAPVIKGLAFDRISKAAQIASKILNTRTDFLLPHKRTLPYLQLSNKIHVTVLTWHAILIRAKKKKKDNNKQYKIYIIFHPNRAGCILLTAVRNK